MFKVPKQIGTFHKSVLKTSQDFPHHSNSNLDYDYWDGYKHSSNFLFLSGYGQATYITKHAMLYLPVTTLPYYQSI